MKGSIRVFGMVIVIVALGAVGYLQFGPQRARAATATNAPTATAQVGTLAATVGGAGNIAARQVVNLAFAQSGTASKVNVQVGDRVKAGEMLAEIDTSDLQLQLQNAQVNLRVAQDKLAQAKTPSTTQDIANARAQVDSAQANYNKLVAGASQADLAAAQAQVTSAQAAYVAAVKSAGTTDSQLQAAAAAIEKAQVALQQAQAAYDKVSGNPNIGMLPQSVTLQQATIDYTTAKANYDSLQATSGSDATSKVQTAKSALEQAQANLAKLKNQVTQDDIVASRAQVTQAQNNLEKLLAGSDANTLDIAQNGVDQAEIAVKQAELKLRQAQIVAPFDGVVTAVNVAAGQDASSSANAAIQLADLDHLEIVVNMAEVDVSKMKVGQQAQITLDALPDANLTGTVAQIAPAGVQSQGVVNYPVTIAVSDTVPGVLTGMTANVNVVTEKKDNVLMVPNRAIRSQGRQKVVTVLFEGQTFQAPVTTGMNNDTMTEITSGLKEGDAVLISSTTTTQPRGVPVVGGFGGGFGR